MIRILTVIAFLAFLSCSTNNKPADGEMFPKLAANMQIDPYNDGSELLRVTGYAEDGTILEQGDYFNGYREGVYTEFYPNGFIKSTVGYVQGKKQGQHVLFDNKGQTLERSSYHNDLLNGTHIKYNRSRIKEESQYSNGLLHGTVEKYYGTGGIMERSNYNSGQLDGISRWYDQKGKNTIAYNYKMGELTGDAELEIKTEPTN